MAQIRNPDTPNAGEGEDKRNSGSLLVGIQSGIATLEVVWQYLPHYFPTRQPFCSSVITQRGKT